VASAVNGPRRSGYAATAGVATQAATTSVPITTAGCAGCAMPIVRTRRGAAACARRGANVLPSRSSAACPRRGGTDVVGRWRSSHRRRRRRYDAGSWLGTGPGCVRHQCRVGPALADEVAAAHDLGRVASSAAEQAYSVGAASGSPRARQGVGGGGTGPSPVDQGLAGEASIAPTPASAPPSAGPGRDHPLPQAPTRRTIWAPNDTYEVAHRPHSRRLTSCRSSTPPPSRLSSPRTGWPAAQSFVTWDAWALSRAR